MFTARNRQNPFAKRRRAQAEAEQAQAVEFDRNPDSEEYVQAPDISTYETGGVVESTHPGPRGAEHMREPEQADPAPVAIEIPAETQAKIDAVMSRAIPPVAEKPLTLDDLIETTTDPGPAPVAEPETPPDEPESDAKRGRGRPRPQETIERDNAVHELLKAADADEGVSKEALAISLGEKEQQVYSSLRQLSKEGRAENRYVKGHGYRWFAA